MALLTPETPARDRPSLTSGRDACRSSESRPVWSSILRPTVPGRFVISDDSFARFVALACHDLRTPLATVGGFANTVQQIAELGDPAERYVGMIASAAEQMAE